MAEPGPGAAPVVRQGYLRKLKTMKKKYFVLQNDSPERSARLEYYDSEKKFRMGGRPKRAVSLKTCFNIAPRLDTKQKYVIALYTKDDCMCIVFDREDDMSDWLHSLWQLMHGDAPQDDAPQPRHHVWQVNVQKKGLGASRSILGLYNLCLTDKKLTLVKIRSNSNSLVPDIRTADGIEFPLMSIRRCGDSECFFYMEVGRSAATGAGELWMHTEDPNIAQSMHTTILGAMSSRSTSKDELEPKSRNRSSSANEASKPISVLTRRQTHTGSKSHGLSPSSESTFCGGRSCIGLCLSPCVTNNSGAYCVTQDVDMPLTEQTNPKSESSNNGVVDVTGSHVAGKPPIEDCPALTVVHERTRSLPLTGEESSVNVSFEIRNIINRKMTLNSSSEKVRLNAQNDGTHQSHKVLQKGSGQANWGRRASTGCRVVKWSPSHSRSGSVGSIAGIRERCDSLPSRANITVVTPHQNVVPISGTRLSSVLRPHSMYIGHGQSPPIVTNSPLSPNSGACSTDSAGSSISIDETDNFLHPGSTQEVPRYLRSTPDDRTIPEEGTDEAFGIWQPPIEGGHENSWNIQEIDASCSVKEHIRKYCALKNLDTSSPVPIFGASPNDGAYMPMSPASMEPLKISNLGISASFANHSRTSSLIEEATNAELNSSKPKKDDGYVDMELSKKLSSQAMSPAGSISSVTSGTPSTDLRFSEFHLEKVSSFLTPSEDDEDSRPARAYSVGSRPDHLKKIINRPETIHSGISTVDSSRTRACSLGSRSKYKDNRLFNHGTPPHHNMHHLQSSSQSGSKSSSVPALSGVPSASTPLRHHYNSSSAEPDDLMEMDFTKNSSSVDTSVYQSTSVQSPLSAPASNTIIEGYMDMSPGNMTKSGYVEMKPVEPVNSGNSTPKVIPNTLRKASITKSPPISNHLSANTPEGYMEMSWNNTKTTGMKTQNRSLIPSLPIEIHKNSPKDTKASNQTASSSASPIFSSILKGEDDSLETKVKRSSPKSSPGASPITPTVQSPHSTLKRRARKQQTRRNSKELSISGSIPVSVPTSFNIPSSPMKAGSPKVSVASNEDFLKRKCATDSYSCGSLDSIDPAMVNFSMGMVSKELLLSPEGSDYMEMNRNSLTTVKEMNESSVDKFMKQFINNATKVYDLNVTADSTDYITLKPSVALEDVDVWGRHSKTLPESASNIYSNVESSCQKTKCLYTSQPISAPKVQNPFRKTSTPAFQNITFDRVDLQGILSSNPLANKTLMSNPLTTSNANILNIKQVQSVRKPALVIFPGQQTQPTTTNFKPISCSELSEPQAMKSGSPKPIESVLNRQLAGTLGDNKNVRSEFSVNRNDGYEILSGQNGQFQSKQSTSRPNSVNNNKCKKGNGCSGSRPPSVTSQGEISGSNITRSRPSSVSSEMSSTPTNSRPASVTGEREGASRGLHYASLELDNALDRSPRPPQTPVANRQTFSYAQIDFVKSEELKNCKNLSAKSKN